MSILLTNGRFQAFDSNGDPLAGGKLYTYVTGTTTPLATYTDSTLVTPNTNPIILDARGEAQVWPGTSTYRLKLNDANDVNIWTTDGVVDSTQAVLATLSPSGGAGLIGFDWATLYTSATAGWGTRTSTSRVPAMKYIPIALWAGLKNGSDATDVSTYLQQAISEAAVNGGVVQLPPWTMCIGTTLTWSARGVALVGDINKDGNTASAASGTCLKWIGATGGVMVSITSGAHQARVEHIMFDANDKADTCLRFYLNGGVSEQIHFPSASHLRFNGYRGKALVFGNPDMTVLESGQLQMASLHHCSWDGGGATATVANVFGMSLNAQNCEILNCSTLYFDPFVGPNIHHQSHIVVKTGGLNVLGAVMTRADSYDIDVLQECGLVLNHIRTEDPLFLRMAAGTPGNPVSVTNIEGRDGTSTGAEIFIQVAGGGHQTVRLDNIQSTGNLQILAANDGIVRVGAINYVHASTTSLVGTPHASGIFDIEDTPGQRTLVNPSANEGWFDRAMNLIYRNLGGKLRVTSLQGVAAGQDCTNFGGAFTVTNPATSAVVTFATAEPDTNYRVICVPNQIVAGAPGNVQVQSIAKTTTTFTVTFSATPAAGAALAFAWMLFRA